MSGRSEISVGVIGGGVGGLACALSLLQAGFDVHVYERAGALSDVGAGVQVSPNASRVLHRLGLAQELARMGVRPVGFDQRRWDDGGTLLRAPLGDAVVEAFGFPYYQLHRADLLAILRRALPEDRVHLAHRLVALDDRGDRVEVTFRPAPQRRSTSSSAPMGSIRQCATSCSERNARGSPVAPRTVAWCLRLVWRTWGSRSRRRSGWGRAGISLANRGHFAMRNSFMPWQELSCFFRRADFSQLRWQLQ